VAGTDESIRTDGVDKAVIDSTKAKGDDRYRHLETSRDTEGAAKCSLPAAAELQQ
jgi:hypothetical protein